MTREANATSDVNTAGAVRGTGSSWRARGGGPWWVVASVAALIVAGSVAHAVNDADAYVLGPCRWGDVPVRFANAGPHAATFAQAVDDWDQAIGRDGLSQVVAGGAASDVEVRSENYGNIAMDGAFFRRDTAFDTALCDTDRLFVSGANVIVFNSYYATAYGDRRIRSVFQHEFGHAVGLDHNDETRACSGGFDRAVAVMHSFTSVRAGAGACSIDGPQADDVSGLRSVYGGGTYGGGK